MRRFIVSGFTFGLLMGVGLDVAIAQIYRYTDERGNAHYVDGFAAVPEQYRATAEPLPFRNAPPAASSANVPAREPEKGATTIAFTPGQRILTDARINDSTSVRLLVDTGADRTLISPRALVAAGVSLTRGARTEQVRGVTGSAETQRVVIDSLAVGEARVGRMTVYALDMNQPGFEGLLGRDFLEQFNVTIDSSRGMVTIKPK
jgi:predicted aspartyl protease